MTDSDTQYLFIYFYGNGSSLVKKKKKRESQPIAALVAKIETSVQERSVSDGEVVSSLSIKSVTQL